MEETVNFQPRTSVPDEPQPELYSRDGHTFMLNRNRILEDRLASACYRILYMPDDESNPGFWIKLDSNTNIPKPFSVSDVREKLNMGLLQPVADVQSIIPDDEITPKGMKCRERAWNLIGKIVSYEPDIYIPSKRMELLQNVENVSGVKVNNLYGYLGKYWRSGFQQNALAGNYKNCGGARTAESLDSRPGRRKREGKNGKVLTEQDFQNFQYAIEHYYRTQQMTLRQTYDQMLSHLYVRERFKGDPEPVTMGADEKPSYGQFYYWHRTKGDVVQDAIEREGEYNFNLNHRFIPGRTETNLFGPGDSYQIDATIGDFYLVMNSDRGRIAGRPIIVFVKDAWSRMVTGMNITLENSSCQVWKETLLNTIANKADYCKRYGVYIDAEEWPCSALPSSITTDNGELAVKEIDEVVKRLGITVENCPPYRGDLKGIIERTFKTYQLALKPYVPGYVDKDAGERGAEDYRKNSCIDLETFTSILIDIVIFYNNHFYMKDYPRTEDMRRNNIPSIPIHLWKYGAAHRTGALRTVSPEDYLDVLLKQDEATVTGKGIRFNGLYYTCSTAVEGKWFERARLTENFNVPIRYNPFSVDQIFIKGSDGKPIECSLVISDADVQGFSDEDLETVREMDRKTEAEYAQAQDQGYSDMVHRIECKVERCKNEKQNGKKIIENLNRHSIDENREEEKRAARGETAARQAQEKLNLDDVASGKARNEKTAEKPKSYDTVSDDIDRIMNEMGFGRTASVSNADE